MSPPYIVMSPAPLDCEISSLKIDLLGHTSHLSWPLLSLLHHNLAGWVCFLYYVLKIGFSMCKIIPFELHLLCIEIFVLYALIFYWGQELVRLRSIRNCSKNKNTFSSLMSNVIMKMSLNISNNRDIKVQKLNPHIYKITFLLILSNFKITNNF